MPNRTISNETPKRVRALREEFGVEELSPKLFSGSPFFSEARFRPPKTTGEVVFGREARGLIGSPCAASSGAARAPRQCDLCGSVQRLYRLALRSEVRAL
jgi:hypothetical protein